MRRQSPEDSNNIMSNWLTRRVSLSFHQFQSERKNNVHRQRQQSLIFRIRYGLMGTNGRVCLSTTTSTAVEWAGEIRSAHDSSSFNCCWLCRVSNLKQYNRRSLLHHHCTGGSITRPTRPFRVGILHFWCDNKLNSHLRSVGSVWGEGICARQWKFIGWHAKQSRRHLSIDNTQATLTEKKDRMRWTEDVLGWDLLKRYDSLPAKPSKYYHHYPAGAVVSCCGLTSALRTIGGGWLTGKI